MPSGDGGSTALKRRPDATRGGEVRSNPACTSADCAVAFSSFFTNRPRRQHSLLSALQPEDLALSHHSHHDLYAEHLERKPHGCTWLQRCNKLDLGPAARDTASHLGSCVAEHTSVPSGSGSVEPTLSLSARRLWLLTLQRLVRGAALLGAVGRGAAAAADGVPAHRMVGALLAAWARGRRGSGAPPGRQEHRLGAQHTRRWDTHAVLANHDGVG